MSRASGAMAMPVRMCEGREPSPGMIVLKPGSEDQPRWGNDGLLLLIQVFPDFT